MTAPFAERLLAWYDRAGRKHLPWQNPITPYRVWLSEIMLQQTQVDTVVGYFQRFTERLPTVSALAAAPLDEVLHLWTGLGYYARARNLHRAAQLIVSEHSCELPADPEQLAALPGIGRSTAGAIASIAFGQRAAILDGNVKRVLARHRAIAGWPGAPKVANQLWQVAEAYTPGERPGHYTQAIMDLGATLCTRARPRCDECPVAEDCLARASGQVSAFPAPKPARLRPAKAVRMLLVQAADGTVLLTPRPPVGLWGGLYSLPELALEEALEPALSQRFGKAEMVAEWPPLKHSFTHFDLQIHPVQVRLGKRRAAKLAESDGSLWYDPRNPAAVGLAAPVKTLLAQLRQGGPRQQALSL